MDFLSGVANDKITQLTFTNDKGIFIFSMRVCFLQTLMRNLRNSESNFHLTKRNRHRLQLQFILKLVKSSTCVDSTKQASEERDGNDERWRRGELIHYRNCWRRQRASREVLKSFHFHVHSSSKREIFKKSSASHFIPSSAIFLLFIRHRVFTIPLLLVRFYCFCFTEILNLKIQQQKLASALNLPSRRSEK